MDWFLRALQPEEQKAVGLRGARTPREMIEALEQAVATLDIGRGERQEPPRPPLVRCPDPTNPGEGRQRTSRPAYGMPQDESMPTEPDPAASRPLVKPWLAGCALHTMTPPSMPTINVKVNGHPVSAVLDTGRLPPSNLFAWRHPGGPRGPDESQLPGHRVPLAGQPYRRAPRAAATGLRLAGILHSQGVTSYTEKKRPGHRGRGSGGPVWPREKATPERPLQVTHLRTSVYHPQTDGLVERFNQPLKKMIRWVVDKEGRNWDLLLTYELFAVRETSRASTGFTPFELLFGRRPQGLLDVAREAWEGQPSPFFSLVDYVQEMQERIERVMPIVKEHLEAAQCEQKKAHDRPAQPREFRPGDKVLLLIPDASCKFLAWWQGPYIVLERVGPINYHLQQPGKRADTQVYHLNLLKKWTDPAPVVSAFAQLHTDLSERALVRSGEELTTAQSQELTEVKTPPGVMIRQLPYRVPEARCKAIEEEVSQMLQDSIIKESTSPWSRPIVVVPKPNGSIQLCNDFRKLSQVSEFDGYPLPRVEDLVEQLGRA
ncbi:uncharacterized protein LOC128318860 [Pangasianodon hypophthalmus]|uniref:uncharacterized protein LOC128318860 n=1 Tax=Pangasianodon hypophthalmus TaxID=310915 RepID=UPI0023074350|nr:uncharacterized protein LOC128318860 [Pangasianodon hypophthalmus]